MLRIGIIPVIMFCFLISGCKKENGKREYEMQLLFTNGDVLTDHGIVAENKLSKYDGKAVYTTVFNDYFFLKVNGKFVCSGSLIKNGKSGDIIFRRSLYPKRKGLHCG